MEFRYVMHVPGVFNDVANGISRWDKSAIHANPVRARPRIPRQVRELGKKRQRSLHLRIGLEFVRNAPAPSTERAHQGHFGSSVEFRLNVIREPVFFFFFLLFL